MPPARDRSVPERTELDYLTALRFIAALGVVFHHAGINPELIPAWSVWIVDGIRERGSYGVQFFFTLSGFILTWVYHSQRKIGWRKFLTARAARILPVYWFALCVGIPMLTAKISEHVAHHGAAVGGSIAGMKAVAVLLLIQAWSPNFALFWNGVSWSLSAEAFFYLCFPVLLVRLRERSNRTLVAGLCGVLVFEILRTIGANAHPGLAWGFTPVLRIHEFLSGILVCLLYLRGYAPGPIAGVFACLLVGGAIVFPGSGLAVELLRTSATHAGFCLLISALAKPRPLSQPPHPSIRPWMFLGQISYAVYLLHIPLLTLCALAGFSAYTHPGAFLAGLLLLSAATYLFLEEPARQWIRKTSDRPPSS